MWSPSASTSTNYDKPECPILHAKFQGHRPGGSGISLMFYTIYGRGGNLGHMTRTLVSWSNYVTPT